MVAIPLMNYINYTQTRTSLKHSHKAENRYVANNNENKSN